MSRRPANTSRRLGDGGILPFAGAMNPKSRRSPLLSLGLVFLGAFLILAYLFSGPGATVGNKLSKGDGDISCTAELQLAVSNLKSAYSDTNSLGKVLHVGPDTCSVVANFFIEGIEVWGVEPYELEDPDYSCKSLVNKGLVRVADIKFPLPYKPGSFSLLIVSDALDYLTPRYLNNTLPDLARLPRDGLVIFSGNPGQKKPKDTDFSKFGRPPKYRNSSWWVSYFAEIGLEENKGTSKKFEEAASRGYMPSCQVFHLKPRSD